MDREIIERIKYETEYTIETKKFTFEIKEWRFRRVLIRFNKEYNTIDKITDFDEITYYPDGMLVFYRRRQPVEQLLTDYITHIEW